MTGQELYQTFLDAGDHLFGPGFSAQYAPWDQAGPAQQLYTTVAEALNNAPSSDAPLDMDGYINALGWDNGQALYQRLYTIGHRIHI